MPRLRLHLRAYEPHDIDDVVDLHRAPAVRDPTARLVSDSRATYERWMAPSSDGQHVLVAEVPRRGGGGKVVAVSGLSIPKNQRVRHTATFFLAVHEDWQGKGVGEALSREVLRLADEELGLVRIELQVHSDNARAIGLYGKLGFQVEGRLRANILSHGRYLDSFVMGRVRPPPPFATPLATGAPAKPPHNEGHGRVSAAASSRDALPAARSRRARHAPPLHRRR